MTASGIPHRLVTVLIAGVWIGFGLFCKVLDLVPRHGEIVARVLGDEAARVATPTIGVFEVLIGIWVLSGWRSRLCAVTQILLVATMNLLELALARDLLLWGPLNALLALLFIALVYLGEWKLRPGRAT